MGNQFAWNVTVPANTTATVTFPVRSDAAILEGGKPIAHSPDTQFLQNSADGPVYAVGSGVYHFTAPLAP